MKPNILQESGLELAAEILEMKLRSITLVLRLGFLGQTAAGADHEQRGE